MRKVFQFFESIPLWKTTMGGQPYTFTMLDPVATIVVLAFMLALCGGSALLLIGPPYVVLHYQEFSWTTNMLSATWLALICGGFVYRWLSSAIVTADEMYRMGLYEEFYLEETGGAFETDPEKWN